MTRRWQNPNWTPDTFTQPRQLWPGNHERQLANDGRGMCNTGSGRNLVCALGGINCDVDHQLILLMNIWHRLTASDDS